MSLAIRCQKLVKTYSGKPPVEAVQGIDLEVSFGECFGVLGPNGAGKTTTIEMLEGLLQPTSGTLEVLGMDWSRNETAIRQRMGVSLQETQLSERLSVRETMQLFRSFYSSGLTVDAALSLVSLNEKQSSWVKNLSGGQKQRLAFATSIVGDPDILFLDEPTTGLDPASRRQLWDIIRSFRSREKTILLTTHYMEEAERLCDRVAIFDGGKVIALGTPRELIASLGAEHVIEFSLASQTESLSESQLAWIRDIAAVESVEVDHELVRITTSAPHALLPDLFQGVQSQGWSLASLTTRHASLEDVFVRLTGRHLIED